MIVGKHIFKRLVYSSIKIINQHKHNNNKFLKSRHLQDFLINFSVRLQQLKKHPLNIRHKLLGLQIQVMSKVCIYGELQGVGKHIYPKCSSIIFQLNKRRKFIFINSWQVFIKIFLFFKE